MPAVRQIEQVRRYGLRNLNAPYGIVIASDELLGAAERLARFHQERLNQPILVVPVSAIYQEFSGGKQDPTALRDFLKTLYDQDNSPLRVLLLVGDASYDYRGLVDPAPIQQVPAFMPEISIDPVRSYLTDDYYAFLDDGEGADPASSVNTLDIAVGRIPATTPQEIDAYLQKVKIYLSQGSLGSWQTGILFLADDGDQFLHLNSSEALANPLFRQYPTLLPKKLYLDAFRGATNEWGRQFPTLRRTLYQTIHDGVLMFIFTGHGSEFRLTAEQTVTREDVMAWQNAPRYTFFITATCEFGRFDNPGYQSGGEKALLNPRGGVIGLLTTVRLVYAGANFDLTRAFLRTAFSMGFTDPTAPIGIIVQNAKNSSLTGANNRKFVLMGDPFIALRFPRFWVRLDSFRTGSGSDTLKALDRVTLYGTVTNKVGLPLSTFDGVVHVTVLDKPVDVETWSLPLAPTTYTNYEVYLFRGEAPVRNGRFQVSFVLPHNMDRRPGKIRVMFYAKSSVEDLDAAGADTSLVAGGLLRGAPSDQEGPKIEIYLEDRSFTSGRVVSATPLVLVELSDVSGINIRSQKPGGGIFAILDQQETNPLDLSPYFTAQEGTYQQGIVRYRLSDLNPGKHTLTIRAYDTYGNQSERTVEFIVLSAESLRIHRVMNFPNPFSRRTEFFIEHSRAGAHLSVQITILTISGRVVATLNKTYVDAPPLLRHLYWDGQTQDGEPLARGTYLYIVRLRDELTWETDYAYQKLFIF